MTLEELETEFYEDLNGRVTAVRLAAESFEIDFECDHWREERRVAATIVCSDVRESTVSAGYIGGIERFRDHPLLWTHIQPHACLYFSSVPANPFELLGRLHVTHHELFEHWRPARDYLYASPEVLAGGYGQLAQGPLAAVQAYERAAMPFVRCSLVTFEPGDTDWQLVLFDESFIICRDVTLRGDKGLTTRCS
jgi:hypothetical protein